MTTIPILVSVQDEDEDVKGIFSLDGETVLKHIPVEQLKENMADVCHQVTEIVSSVRQIGQFKLKEITIQVEVNCEGGVELIGTAKLGGKGAITLTFSE